MTSEQQKATIKALLYERAGYQKYGQFDRVAEVDAQLERIGHKAKPPAERATRMTAENNLAEPVKRGPGRPRKDT